MFESNILACYAVAYKVRAHVDVLLFFVVLSIYAAAILDLLYM